MTDMEDLDLVRYVTGIMERVNASLKENMVQQDVVLAHLKQVAADQDRLKAMQVQHLFMHHGIIVTGQG